MTQSLTNEATQPAHITVLLNEAVDGLHLKKDGIYVDGTFGRGGHSRHILKQLGSEGRLIAIDRDPRAIATAEKLQDEDPRFKLSMVHFLHYNTILLNSVYKVSLMAFYWI